MKWRAILLLSFRFYKNVTQINLSKYQKTTLFAIHSNHTVFDFSLKKHRKTAHCLILILGLTSSWAWLCTVTSRLKPLFEYCKWVPMSTSLGLQLGNWEVKLLPIFWELGHTFFCLKAIIQDSADTIGSDCWCSESKARPSLGLGWAVL